MSPVRRFLERPGWDTAFRVLVIISFALGAWSYVGARDLASCQQKYNDSFNLRAKILSDATAQERQAEATADAAQAALWLSPLVTKPAQERTPADQAELRRIFAEYQAALAEQQRERAEADKLRLEHPVPPPPSQTC